MMHTPGLFDLSDHPARLSATGDPLEALERHVDFEVFRTVLMAAPGYGGRAKGGRPPYDPVTMFKVLVLASMHNPGDERMEFLIRDRLSWLRFPGFQIGEPTPDQKTIWLFREKLTRSGAFKSLFAAFENQLCERGYKPRGGQIVDATLVSAPRQRMRKEEKERAGAFRKTGVEGYLPPPGPPLPPGMFLSPAIWSVGIRPIVPKICSRTESSRPRVGVSRST